MTPISSLAASAPIHAGMHSFAEGEVRRGEAGESVQKKKTPPLSSPPRDVPAAAAA